MKEKVFTKLKREERFTYKQVSRYAYLFGIICFLTVSLAVCMTIVILSDSLQICSSSASCSAGTCQEA